MKKNELHTSAAISKTNSERKGHSQTGHIVTVVVILLYKTA